MNNNLFTGEYVTITFVVRHTGDLEEPEDPRTLLTNDEVMFWGSEPGITPHAITLGADLSSWHEDVETTATCRHCGRAIGYSTEEGWVCPEAGYDTENGDGIWRATCEDNHEDRIAAHEPDDIDTRRCRETGEHQRATRHRWQECPVYHEGEN